MRKKYLTIFVLMIVISHSMSLWNQTQPIRDGLETNISKISSHTPLKDTDPFISITKPSNVPFNSKKTDLSRQYTSYEPIRIQRDSDFIKYGFPGNGSQRNPYLIEKLNITYSSKYTRLIDIGSTTAYFHIQNNILNGLSGDSPGIWLVKVVHATVDSNVIMNCGTGIILSHNSRSNTISNNIVENNNNYGIQLVDSYSNTLFGNKLINNSFHVNCHYSYGYYQTNVTNNTINGKPLIFWQNMHNRATPANAGQIILVNSTSIEVTKQNLSQVSNGIIAVDCSNLNIHHNVFSHISQAGIHLRASKNNTICNNIFINNSQTGITLRGFSDMNLMDKDRNNLGSDNCITNNTISYSSYGISLKGLSNDNASQNTIINCNTGIYIMGINHILSNNKILECETGIDLWGAANNTFAHNFITKCETGIKIIHSYGDIDVIITAPIPSKHNLFSRNIINECSTGIIFYQGTGTNSISYNNISSSKVNGIRLWGSTNNSVTNNYLVNNGNAGIELSSSRNNKILNNTFSNNHQYGIALKYSKNNNLQSNNFLNNGLFITGMTVEDYLQTDVSSNVVNGKPLIYWQNLKNRTLPFGAGQVVLINTSSIRIREQNLSLGSIGIIAAFSTDLNILHNTIHNNSQGGLLLKYSRNNKIDGNIISNNGIHGVIFAASGNNRFIDNQLINNGLSVSGPVFDYFQHPIAGNPDPVSIEDYYQAEVTNNMINGKPLYYLQNVSNQTIPDGAGQIILVNATGIEIAHQNFTKISVGLCVAFSKKLKIHHNMIKNNEEGIILAKTINSKLHHNNITAHKGGVALVESNNIYMTSNIVVSGYIGIYLSNARNNTITSNSITNGSYNGISLRHFSMNNNISHNTLLNNRFGILSASQNNTLTHNSAVFCESGFYLLSSSNTLVTSNLIENCSNHGIALVYTDHCDFMYNIINNNRNGIILEDSSNNTMTNNTLYNNERYGIQLVPDCYQICIYSEFNLIQWNSFIDNNLGHGSQARDMDKNNTFVNNYWSDHIMPDNNADGIIDTAYVIDGTANNKDMSPLSTLPNFPSLSELIDIITILALHIILFIWFKHKSDRK